MIYPLDAADEPGDRSAAALAAASAALSAGLLVGIPTDTVYGLAVDPNMSGATDRLFAVKRRPRRTPLAVLVADIAQVEALADEITPIARTLMERFWPGALTLVVARNRTLPIDLGDAPDNRAPTIGVRSPAHPLVRALCGAVGPLGVTSANLHGEPEYATAGQVYEAFGDAVPVVIDGGECSGRPSTVVDCTGPGPVLIRAGGIDWPVIVAALATSGWSGG